MQAFAAYQPPIIQVNVFLAVLLQLATTAGVAKLADALDLGSSGAIHVGSTPIARTKPSGYHREAFFVIFGMSNSKVLKPDNMTPAAIRDRLYDYIRVADDKKIKAIYMMLEDDISEEAEWWNNPVFVAQLEKEYEAWDSGKEKSFSLADIKNDINKRRLKKYGK